jgi:hypothetical protein
MSCQKTLCIEGEVVDSNAPREEGDKTWDEFELTLKSFGPRVGSHRLRVDPQTKLPVTLR